MAPPSKLLDERSRHLRRLVVEALESAGRGHVGPSLSLIEVFRVLYDDFLAYRPSEPGWRDRDRCILSKGHGCLAQYVLLADKGFFPRSELKRFCEPEGLLGGHPERGRVPGVEASTGALGHGLSVGVGMALAGRIRGQSYRVVVVAGDGELGEGSNWEAALACAKHRLSNLTLMVDSNQLQCYGRVDQALGFEPLADKLRSFGFAVASVDGHDVGALKAVMERLPLVPDRPSAIVCHTVKGKGLPFAEHAPEWHYRFAFAPDEIRAMHDALGPA
jgi:transketolase